MARTAQWYVARGKVREGPYAIEQLRAMLVSGALVTTDMIWQEGTLAWKRADAVEELFPPPPVSTEIRVGRSPALPPSIGSDGPSIPQAKTVPAPPSTATPMTSPAVFPSTQPTPLITSSVREPWSPTTIAVFGLLFTPMWCGVMAAINGSRLGSKTPVWLPVLIGFGYLVVELVAGSWIESILWDWFLYLGAAAILWVAVLRDQVTLFAGWRAANGSHGPSWGWPVFAGVPLAILVLLGFVIGPLLPLEPRQVCEKFIQATSETGMKNYTTKNLSHAISVLAKAGSKNELLDAELCDEGPAPANIGGYFVGFRTYFIEFGQRHSREGVFHVVQRSGEWKIDDIAVTVIDNRSLDPWWLFTDNPSLFVRNRDDSSKTPTGPSKVANQKPGAQSKEWYERPGTLAALGRFLGSGALKTVGAVLVGIAIVIGRFGNALGRLFQPRASDNNTSP
jgi:hypothetical protein